MSLLGGSAQFRKNIARMTSAHMIAQAVAFLALPVLSRLYSPEDFAILTTYSVLQSIGLSFVTARADWLLPNARNRYRAALIFSAGFVALIFFSLSITLIMFLFETDIMRYFSLDEEFLIYYLLPVGLIVGGLQLMFQAWYVLGRDLTNVGWARLAQGFATVLLSVALVLIHPGPLGLVISYVLGFVAAALVLGLRLTDLPSIHFRKQVKHSFSIIHFYRTELAASVALATVNITMTSSIILLLITWYDSEIVGWYGLVFRVATAPIGLITTAVVQSFWSEAASLAKTDARRLKTFYLGATKRLVILTLPFLFIFALAPYYIPFLFGEERWSGAGTLLVAVSPYLAGMIIFSPTTHLIVYNKAHWQLWCDCLTLAMSVLVFSLLAFNDFSAEVSIFSSSCAMLLGYVARFSIHLRANDMLVMMQDKL